MTELLTVQAVSRAATNAQQHVQDYKIVQSVRTIRRLQQQERWPEKYVSYSGTVGRNPFKEPRTFFRVIRSKPKKWREKFTFLPIVPENTRYVRLAVEEALDYWQRQYSKMLDSGMYGRNMMMYITSGASKRRIRALDDINNMKEGEYVEITNLVSYASTMEVNALYYAKNGGMLYHVAQKIRTAYPQVGVWFGYLKAAQFGATHVYDLPVLRIGTREKVADRIKKPGTNYSRRQRYGRRLRRLRSQV